MKKFNLWASMIALFLCVGFTSCGDDDNNAENAGTGNIFPEGVKKVATISDAYGGVTKFTYADNKLVSVDDGDSKYTFAYSGNTVTMTSIYEYGNSKDTEVYTMNIGSNGFISHGTGVYTEVYNNETYTSNTTMSFSYDKDGHLTTVQINEKDSDGDEYTTKIQLTWEDGNITKTVENWTEKEDGDTDSGTNTRTFTYGGEVNKIGFSFFDEVVDLDELEYAYYAGLLGKSTKNMLKSVKSVDEGDYSYTSNYSYEFDGDYPTVFNSDGSKYKYTYK